MGPKSTNSKFPTKGRNVLAEGSGHKDNGASDNSGFTKAEVEMETASFNLPLELIELCRELAEARLKRDRAEKREARKRGEKPPQARRSASAVVAEALEAHRASIEAEIKALNG